MSTPRDKDFEPIVIAQRATVEIRATVGKRQPAPVLLQAVVQSVGDTEDGDIVRMIAPAWEAILRELALNPRARFEIPWRRWEELIAAQYEAAGFDEVILTPRSGDGGKDVIAAKRGFHYVRIVDQMKALGDGQRVTAEEVHALLHVVQDAKATKGVVSTTAEFAPGIATAPSIAPYVPARLELYDGQTLLERLESLRKK
jgi:restriction system protein